MYQLESRTVVPVTALCLFLEDKEESYRRYVHGMKPLPGPGLIYGQIEHLARKITIENLKGIYLIAKNEKDLRNAYTVLEESIEKASIKYERKFGCFDFNIASITNEILNRLRIEEDMRIIAAENLLRDGIQGFNLVNQLFPIEVEQYLRSEELGIEGCIDAVGLIGDKRYPIEYKTGRKLNGSSRESHIMQVTAYCILLEERYDYSSEYAEIYYSRYFNRVPVIISEYMRNRVTEIRREFLEYLENDFLNVSIDRRVEL